MKAWLDDDRLRRARPAGPAFGLAAIAVLATVAVSGCVQQEQVPKPSAAPSTIASPSTTASPSASPSPAIPVFDPNGSAVENLSYFEKVGHALLDHNPNAPGKTIVDYFVANGFDKKNMEVTPDKTSIGLQAWNIEFSVRINGTCLIGQAGNVGFQATAQPLLATGKCLIGTTRTIDW